MFTVMILLGRPLPFTNAHTSYEPVKYNVWKTGDIKSLLVPCSAMETVTVAVCHRDAEPGFSMFP